MLVGYNGEIPLNDWATLSTKLQLPKKAFNWIKTVQIIQELQSALFLNKNKLSTVEIQ